MRLLAHLDHKNPNVVDGRIKHQHKVALGRQVCHLLAEVVLGEEVDLRLQCECSTRISKFDIR